MWFCGSSDLGRCPSYSIKLKNGTLEHIDKIDKLISEHSLNWDFNRLLIIDKCILRFAVYELLFEKELPKEVIIDEAIEISKKFSESDSYKFINGILDKISMDLSKLKPKKILSDYY